MDSVRMSSYVISKIGLFLPVLVAIVLISFNFQSTDRLLPINVDIFYQGKVRDEDSQRVSCPTAPPLPMTERTNFGTDQGCIVYGYPSTGGFLVKHATLVDMLFLSHPRFHESQRSPSADEEDRFCNLLRRTGANLWPSKEDVLEVEVGLREATEEEEKVLVFGWPTDGVGAWVLRYKSARELPKGFGRLSLAMNMEEKIQVMREYGATFVEDVTQVEELF